MSELQFFGHIIDNEEVESIDGKRFDVWNPWTREVWAQAAEASEKDADRAIASARKAFDEGPWPRMGRAERAARDPPARRPHGGARRRPGHASTPRTWASRSLQAKHDVARSVWNFRFFADHQRDAVGEVYPMDSRSPHLQRVRAGRRRRGDQPVELPADDGVVEDRAGDRVGQHLHHQAERGHPRIGDAARPPGRRGRLPARGAQRASTATGRRRARRSPATTGSTG